MTVEMGGTIGADVWETREDVTARLMRAFEEARASQFPTWDGEPEIHRGEMVPATPVRIWGWRAEVPVEYVL